MLLFTLFTSYALIFKECRSGKHENVLTETTLALRNKCCSGAKLRNWFSYGERVSEQSQELP